MGADSEHVAGLVIAGGRSLRFGGEKAVAMLQGQSLLARARGRLVIDCRIVAINARMDSQAARAAADMGVAVVSDVAGAPSGPLAGVLAGLLWAQGLGASLLVTLPCDTPLVPDDLATRLLSAAEGRDAAVARTPDGVQSLCAAWRTSLIAPLRARLASGEHPAVRAVLDASGCGFVDYADAGGFLNINTPQDLVEAERRLGGATA